MDPAPAHAGVDLDDARAATRALALDVQDAAVQPEGPAPSRTREVDEPAPPPSGRGPAGSAGRSPGTRARPSASSATRSRTRTRRPCITRSTSNSTPSRYSSSSRSLPVAEDLVVLGRHDAAHEGVDLRQIFEVVDPHAPHRARSELGLHHRREPDVGGGGEQLVERAHAPGRGRRQPQLADVLAGADLAAGRVDRLRRVAGQPQRGRHTRRHARRCSPRRSGRRRVATPAAGQRVERPPRRRVGVSDDRAPRSHAAAMPSSTSASDQ